MKVKPAIASVAVTLSQAISQFILLAAIAKSFGAEQVGSFSLVNSIILPASMLFSFGLRQAYVVNQDDYGFKTFFALRCIGLSFSFLISFGIIFFINKELLNVFWWLFLVRAVVMMMEFMVAVHQSGCNLSRILVSQFARYTLTTIIFVFSCYFIEDFISVIAIFAISNILLFLIFEIRDIYKGCINDAESFDLVQAASQFFLLGASNFINSVQANAPRFLLGTLGSSYLLGIFSISFQLYNMSATIFTSAANYYLKPKKKVGLLNVGRQSSSLFMVICAGYSLFLIVAWFLFGDYFISLFLTSEYQIISSWIYVLMVFLFIRNLGYSFNWRLISESRFNVIAKYNSFALVISVLSSFVLIHYFEFSGAHYSIGASSLIYLVCMSYAHKFSKL